MIMSSAMRSSNQRSVKLAEASLCVFVSKG